MKKITAVSTTRHALESEASRSLRDDRNLAMSMPTELLEPADAEPTPESLLPCIIDRHKIFLNIEKSSSLIENHLPNWANVQQSNVKFSRKGNRRTRSSFEYSTCTNSLFTAGLKLFDEEMPEEKDEKKWLQEKIHALWIIRHSWLIEIFSDSKWEILTGSSFQLEMYRFQLFIKSHRLSYHNFTFWYFISKWSRDRSTANHVTDIYLSSDSYGLAIYRVVLMERRR